MLIQSKSRTAWAAQTGDIRALERCVDNTWIEKARALLFPPADKAEGGEDRSAYERFAIPYTFKPQLSLAEAIIAVGIAFLRIFLGSMLFAIWGTYSLVAWNSIRGSFWRVAALVPMVALFVLALGLLMLGISALVRSCSPRRP